MARTLSADEVQNEHLTKLSPELGPVYHALWNECAWLHVKWQQYEELYGTKPERVDLLNHTAGVFFRVVQDSLWNDILLHLTALTDPPKSFSKKDKKNKENLTIRRFPELVGSGDFQEEIKEAVDAALATTEFARDWRNRKIAHRDLALAMQAGVEPLASANRLKVRGAIDAVCEVIRKISLKYLKSDIRFDLFLMPGNGVDLLYIIRDGLEADAARRERLRTGKPDPKDLETPNPV